MKTLRSVLWVLIGGCFAWMWAGCDQGSMEKAGKAVDDKLHDLQK